MASSGSEVWFDFWLPDGSLGGFCSLGGHGYLAGLVGTGRPYLLVREPDAPARGYEVRTEGLWADFNQESADGSHWSWGLEAFGVAFDDPEEAVRSEWGDRTALGFDLEWEAPERVYGEILVGPSERIAFDGFGRAESGISDLSRPNAVPPDQSPPKAFGSNPLPPKGFGSGAGVGLAAPVRFEDGRVLRQHLTADGWVRAWDGSAAGTA